MRQALDTKLTIIQSKIYEIRGSRVMLDFDLAKLYSTEIRYIFVLQTTETKQIIN